MNVKVVSWSLGIWGGITFVICVLYGLVVTASVPMHQSLEHVLPGFKWLTLGGFVIGLAWSVVYGLYAGWLFATIYNRLSRRWAAGR
jgi:hypothetical protein